jgi:hypothetical protein
MRPFATFAVLVSLSALLDGCSSASSEPVAPESSAKPEASATVAASATSAPVAPTATASASAVADTPKPPQQEAGPDLKIVPMKIALAKDVIVELKQDGSLWINADKKSEQIGQVAKNQVRLTAMDLTYSVFKDGSLDLPAPPGFPPSPKVRFDDKDNLLQEDGAKITIDDKGKLGAITKDGKAKSPKDAPVVTGFKPEARRTALLLLLLPIAIKAEPKKGS